MDHICYFRGAFVPLSEAKVSIMTHSFMYGTGCFEGIRGYWNDDEGQLFVFRMPEHYVRFKASQKVLMFSLPHTVDELCEITLELLKRNNFKEDVYIRPAAYKASETIGVKLHGLEEDIAILAVPFGKYVDIERPLRVCTSSWQRIDDNAMPARSKIVGAYVNSAFAKSEALLNGFDEAIMLTSDGHVSEGSAENIFLVVDGVLVTPPVCENILVGITRATVMELAEKELGLRTVERKIDRTELYVADEIFLVGTGAQIAPVGEVDRRPVGNGEIGPVTRRLQEIYFDVVRGRNANYRHWCTAVYPVRASKVAGGGQS